jgi:hypothetical protein
MNRRKMYNQRAAFPSSTAVTGMNALSGRPKAEAGVGAAECPLLENIGRATRLMGKRCVKHHAAAVRRRKLNGKFKLRRAIRGR